MSNAKAEIQDNNLIITVPLEDPPKESKSGKTFVVASTHGFSSTDAKVEGKPVWISVNATIKKEN